MTALHDKTFRAIAELMHSSIGLSFAAHKKPLVASRLAPRLQRLGIDGYEDYLALIAGDDDQGEFQVAVDLLTTNETYFFREPAHYELLEQELARRRPASLRVWSAASSFGDEAYSTAMLLADLQTQGRIGDDWSILGTDISDRVLRSASQAIYPQERLRNVSPERLKRYCWRGEGEADGLSQMQPKLRERVRFGQLNLCVPIENIGPFDVVFLRNVLIYFDPPTKAEVVDRVLTQLRPDGILFLGTAEGRVPCRTPLKVLAPGAFRKVAG
ncbi:protein-glutamate O-methyltransferase CheR [Rhizobacter sp. AJA081-3]|jgi:chemotaxis protein methyltransferase CheR|uniref:CheR family methyltransferase n=1 Tax=Rhizobacter sp. AJA081-3 TaxID=2753607 RepID=UPI001ADF921C|nr:protein-glutamate O-methyltransferase CheR [Rhizobacter sp. AJA081-3]QTN23616.1 protein-glutamate O-methyltransferase CheR [Rhizobacter sp. AJA081-3]